MAKMTFKTAGGKPYERWKHWAGHYDAVTSAVLEEGVKPFVRCCETEPFFRYWSGDKRTMGINR